MLLDNYTLVGHTRKSHGVKGEIKVHIEDRFLEDFLNTKTVFIETKGKMLPLFIEQVRSMDNLITKFEDFNTPESLTLISSKDLYMLNADILPDEEREWEVEEPPYIHLVGYDLYHLTEFIGKIESVEEYPHQMIAILPYQGREILIPLTPHFITEIDDAAKKVIMDMPEGLLDL